MPGPTQVPPFHLHSMTCCRRRDADLAPPAGSCLHHPRRYGRCQVPVCSTDRRSPPRNGLSIERGGFGAGVLYLLGDIVYYYGEQRDYAQFYEPYALTRPKSWGCRAITTATCSMLIPLAERVRRQFCATAAPDAALGEVARETMNQPQRVLDAGNAVRHHVGLYTMARGRLAG